MTANDKARAAMATTAVAARTTSPADSMLALLASDSMRTQFAMALPKHLNQNAERYIRTFMTQIRQTPKLLECNKTSLLGAMLTGTALGLDPSPSLGEFYILPYGQEAQFQLGYRGMKALAYRGGVRKITAHEVCANDEFSMTWGLEDTLTHKPLLTGDRGPEIGYYVAVKMANGEVSFKYMTRQEVESHGKRFSKTYGRGPWATDFAAMAEKTCLKLLFKWLPISVELAKALDKDESTVNLPVDKAIVDAEGVLDIPAEDVADVESVGGNDASAPGETPAE